MKAMLQFNSDGEQPLRCLARQKRDMLMFLSLLIWREDILRWRQIMPPASIMFSSDSLWLISKTVGYLVQAIQNIEENQFPSHLTDKNPTKAYLRTAIQDAKTIDKSLRDAVRDPRSIDKVIEYLNRDPATWALVRTSTAADVVQGEVKCVLPQEKLEDFMLVLSQLTHYQKVLEC
jgi:hypothetical protein